MTQQLMRVLLWRQVGHGRGPCTPEQLLEKLSRSLSSGWSAHLPCTSEELEYGSCPEVVGQSFLAE